MEVNSTVLLEGDTYIVFIDAVIGDELASFVLHAEGNPRVIYRLVKENSDKLHSNKYYMLKDVKTFGNHSEVVATIDGKQLYKLKGFKC